MPRPGAANGVVPKNGIGIAFWIAGVPGAFLLGFATFVLSFVPMGPLLLWAPAAGWLYYQGATRGAIFLVICSLVTNVLVEQALKPIIIARTGGTPFLIVLFGACQRSCEIPPSKIV